MAKGYKKARVRAYTRGRKSDFQLQVIARNGKVYFDRIYNGPYGEDRQFLVAVKGSSARKLGEWLVNNA